MYQMSDFADIFIGTRKQSDGFAGAQVAPSKFAFFVLIELNWI